MGCKLVRFTFDVNCGSYYGCACCGRVSLECNYLIVVMVLSLEERMIDNFIGFVIDDGCRGN